MKLLMVLIVAIVLAGCSMPTVVDCEGNQAPVAVIEVHR